MEKTVNLLKTLLVRVLDSDFPEQTNIDTNASCLTAARYTDKAEPQLLVNHVKLVTKIALMHKT